MRRFLPVAAIALPLLVLLTACASVGPDYRIPGRAIANGSIVRGEFAGAAVAPVSVEVLPGAWWRLFDEPTLDSLVTEAIAANADLRVAEARLLQARMGLVVTQATAAPRGGVSADAARTRLSAESYLLSEPLPVMNIANAGVSVSYEVDLFGRLRRAIEAAQADADVAEAGRDLVRIAVAGEVVRAYVQACAAGHELLAAEASIEVQAQSLDAVARLATRGRASTVDLLRAQVLVDQSRAALPVFESRRQAALYRLATLAGRPPTDFPAQVATCHALPNPSRPIPVGNGAALLRRRPDVRQAERALAAATARIGVATAALYPTISVGLGAGSTGLLADLGSATSNRWNLGPLISWTFPTGGERARLHAAGAGADAALARFDGSVLDAVKEVETALSVYRHDLERRERLRVARDAAAESHAQIRHLFDAGRSAYLAALDAERTLDGLESLVAAADSQVADDQVALFLALGGGWEAEDAAIPGRLASTPARTSRSP